MGVELELYVLLVLLTLGSSVFAVFEVETPWWRTVLKWFIVIAATVGLYQAAGHLAVLVPILAGGAGSVVLRTAAVVVAGGVRLVPEDPDGGR